MTFRLGGWLLPRGLGGLLRGGRRLRVGGFRRLLVWLRFVVGARLAFLVFAGLLTAIFRLPSRLCVVVAAGEAILVPGSLPRPGWCLASGPSAPNAGLCRWLRIWLLFVLRVRVPYLAFGTVVGSCGVCGGLRSRVGSRVFWRGGPRSREGT